MERTSHLDKEFIQHLREEKLAQQDRRASYVRLKFSFIIGLFSGVIISLKFDSPISNTFSLGFLYLAPLVAVLFDYYILGGDFAVKRIRAFLSEYDTEQSCEKRWDEFLRQKPKSFMRMNRFWVTNFIYFISISANLYALIKKRASIVEWCLFIGWLFIIMFLWFYLIKIEKIIKDAFITKRST